jgi:predicted murein hydrolase (TIGR00659 family)
MNTLSHVAIWSTATVAAYLVARWLYSKWRRPWVPPLVVAPLLLALAMFAFGVPYRDYASGAGWLVGMLGPATVAFAVPIYEQRALIRREWRVLLAGGVAGSATAVATSWGLATLLEVHGAARLSLLPRSTSTPFAMEVSARIGGVPELTAVFVVVTGVLGALVGEVLLARLPLRSTLARGALLGAGAHAVGTAKANELGQTEGAVSALVMVLVGLLNVASAPLLARLLR